MIQHRPHIARGAVRWDWLNTRAHFRVGQCGRTDPAPIGALYVWNDDEFAPHSGFDPHAHRDVEIVTWVRSGAITYEDDAGNRARLVADSVQVMSAGTAVHHSERNDEDVPARLFQIWPQPRTSGATPRWATRICSRGCREGRSATPTMCARARCPSMRTRACVSQRYAKARRCTTCCRRHAGRIWLPIMVGLMSAKSGSRHAMELPYATNRSLHWWRETTPMS